MINHVSYTLGLFLILFVYLLNLKVVFPPYYMILPIAFLGGLLFYLNLNNFGRVNKIFVSQLFLLLGFLFFWSISSIINSVSSYDYIKEIFITSILFLFSALFINYYTRNKDPDFVITMIGQVVVFQLLLSFIAYLSPTFFNIIFSIVQVDNLEGDTLAAINDARMVGVGKSFFGLGVLNCITLLLLAFQISKKTKYIVWDVIAYITIAFVGFLGARTTIVGFLLSLILFYKNPKIILKSILGLFFLIVLVIPFYNILIQNDKIILLKDFGFDLLLDTDDSQAAQSFGKLTSMFDIYPDNLKTWVFGDVFYRTEDGGYYKNTDVGYFRIIFSGGIIGLIYYMFVSFFMILKSRFIQQSKVLMFLLILLFLVLNIKGVANIYYFLAILLFLKTGGRSK
ncbi:hypothetical protein RZ600_002639 [Acinetobacter baumannii]|nr:hypothetical protein [Acinetobacter baumannii]ELN4070454.1 hypothetical protein [Acinetobacter baumannii]